MNFKNNKGYVITDVSISIIILLILIPVIMGMVYKVNTTKRATESKAEAINILVNTLEAAKGIGVTDLVDSGETTAKKLIFEKIKEDIYKEKISFEENETESAIVDTDKGKYLLSLEVVDFADSDDSPVGVQRNVVKIVKAKIEYRINGKNEELNISTVLK